MRINRHLAIAITTVFVFQGVLCPAVCLAGNPSAAAAKPHHAAADSEQSSSHSEQPCHQSQQGAPQDAPAHDDDSPACTSCGSETPLAYTVEKESDTPSAVAIASPTAIGQGSTERAVAAVEFQHLPPPARLYLLNSSFLI